MPDDAISALLPLLLSGGGGGGGGGGMSPDALGTLQAMQTPFAQGVPSNAGPIGQITQALMPLVAGPAYAQQARQQQAQQQRDMLIKVLTLTKELKGVDLQNKKLQAEAEALGVNKQFMERYMGLHGAVHGDATDEMVKNAKVTVGPHGATFQMGGTPSAGTMSGMQLQGMEQKLEQVLGRKPEPAEVYDFSQREKARVAQEASDRAIQKSQELTADHEASREKERLNKPLESGSNIYAYDPMTAKRAAGARVGDLETGKVIKLSGNDLKALTNAKDAWRQLDRLEKLSNELLPKTGGILKTPISLVSGATKEAFGDPKWREFDQLASFLKFPVLQATVRGRPPLAESRTIREVTKSDNQASAKQKIDEFRAQISGLMDTMGFAPTALEPAGAKPPPESKAGSGNLGVEIGRQIEQMKQMGKNPDDIKKVLMSIYGGDIDVDIR
jgi:hypothetical protein